jgi:hypothetical protein
VVAEPAAQLASQYAINVVSVTQVLASIREGGRRVGQKARRGQREAADAAYDFVNNIGVNPPTV